MGLTETMKALSDPTRRSILLLLRDETMAAGKIAEHFDMTAATISHHLAQLKKARLIMENKRKNFIYYSINKPVLEDVLSWVNSIKEGDRS